MNNKGLLCFSSYKFSWKAIVHVLLFECVEIYCVEKYCYYLPLYAETYAANDRISFFARGVNLETLWGFQISWKDKIDV